MQLSKRGLLSSLSTCVLEKHAWHIPNQNYKSFFFFAWWIYMLMWWPLIHYLMWFPCGLQFVDYGKMIYLDGDIQVFDNIDHLFEKPTGYFYAVMDCFCEKTWSTTPQYQIKYCQQCPEKVQWPLEMGSPPPLYFNAGMCLFEPKLETYFDLLETLKATTPTSFAEQVINLACLGYLLLLFFGRLSYIIYSPLFFGYSRKEVVDFSIFN